MNNYDGIGIFHIDAYWVEDIMVWIMLLTMAMCAAYPFILIKVIDKRMMNAGKLSKTKSYPAPKNSGQERITVLATKLYDDTSLEISKFLEDRGAEVYSYGFKLSELLQNCAELGCKISIQGKKRN